MFGNRCVRKLEFVLIVAVALVGTSASAWAQFKLSGKIIANPEGTTSPLIFDINAATTDNVSSNIVLNVDGQRGFVAYTGSGEIAEFSLSSGEILNRIKTTGLPFYATPLPDNRRLAVVSVLDNEVFIVDMDSNPSSLVATYKFAKAQFGFGSIITLSPDGSAGYVSSTGTGEVIKFDVNDGHEIARFTGPTGQKMRYPAQITVTPDGATIIVVDTDPASPEVDFFDSTTFAKNGSLKNPDPANYFVAFTIFNKAVLAPDGKTGIIANTGRNSVLYSELVFQFDATNGTILKKGSAGPAPAWTGLTPDGKNWIILSMFSLTVIPTDNFDGAVEYQAPAGESLGSANVVFSPDSRFAYYATTGASGVVHDQIIQMELSDGAVTELLQVGDSPDTIVDQPASIAISADGKMIVTAEFASNNIDFMTPLSFFAGAKFVSSLDTFTGLSLINLSSNTNNVTVYAMQDFGEPNQETGVTNPVTFNLAPNQQISKTVAEIFNFDDSTAPVETGRTGWLAIYSDYPELTGYVSIGKTDLSYVNGLSLDSTRAHEFILPEIERGGDQQMEISSLNDTYFTISFIIQRVAHDGSVIDTYPSDATTTTSASANNRLSQFMPDLFPRNNLDTEGYLYFNSGGGLLFTEFYNDGVPNATEAIKALDINRYAGVKTIVAPQFATVPGFSDTLNLINANVETANVTVTFHGADGTVLWQFQKAFKRGEQLKGELNDLFNNPPSDVTTVVADPSVLSTSGWLQVDSDQDEILGTLTFRGDNDQFITSTELSGAPLSKFLFPVVSQNDTYQTGLALLNNNQSPAQVTLELWDTDGNMIASTSPMTLAPKARTVAYLDALFPGMDPIMTGNVRVRSDQPLNGFAVVNNPGFTFLLTMQPIALF